MEDSLHYAKQLYVQCCLRRKTKPNKNIMAQVDRPDVVLVEVIDTSVSFIGRAGVLAVLDFTFQHRSLRKLILSGNDIDTSCVEYLCTILKGGHPSLSSVDLSYSNLSVPAMRFLWETARDVHSLVEVCLNNSQVPREWAERLTRQLSKNFDLQRRLSAQCCSLHNTTGLSSPWHTTFVLLISSKDSQVEFYNRHVLQVLSHPAATLQRRLALIVIGPNETKEYVEKTMQYCLEDRPWKDVWCVVLLDGAPFTEAQRIALDMALNVVLPSTACPKNEGPDVAECLFVYYVDQESPSNDLEPITNKTIPPSAWLELIGYSEKQCMEWVSRIHCEGCVLRPEICKLRCQSDLFSMLRKAYGSGSDKDPIPSTAITGSASDALGKSDNDLHPASIAANSDSTRVKCLSTAVERYIEVTPDDVGPPLLIYGAPGNGKGNLLRQVASSLLKNSDQRNVSFLEVDSRGGGLIVLLYRILQLLDPKAVQKHYYSVKALELAVKDAVAGYHGRIRLILIVSRVDKLNLFGVENATFVDWLPALLPPKLRIILSMDTDPTLLHHLRQRSPQPWEYLVGPTSDVTCINTYYSLLTQVKKFLPLVKWIHTNDGLSTVAKSYTEKPDSQQILYSRLAAAYTEHRLNNVSVETPTEAVLLIEKQLPGSVNELIQAACEQTAAIYGHTTVSWVLLALTICPLAAMDIEEVCERLGNCPAHTSVPSLLLLVEFGILEFDCGANARFGHHTICAQTVLHLYDSELDRVSVAVETHLHLKITQGMNVYDGFCYLVPLMLSNGNFTNLMELLSNVDLIDCMLSYKDGFFYMMEAFFQLLNACDLMDKLASTAKPLNCLSLHREAIECSLRAVQLAPGPGFLQHCLLSYSESRLHHSARDKLSHVDANIPYPMLVRLRCDTENENVVTLTGRSALPIIHLHCRDEYLVASTAVDVTVYHTQALTEVAHMVSPFKPSTGDTILGSFMGIGPRAVILASGHVSLWNFIANTFVVFEDVSATVEPFCLDTFGDSVMISQPAKSSSFSVLSVSQRQKVRELPPPQLPGRPRRARFCGAYPLIIESHCVYIFADSQVVSLAHDDGVGAIDCSSDGQLLASAVGNVLHVWKSTGTLLHRINMSLSRIIRLSFDGSGFALVLQQADSVTVWQTARGVLLSQLSNPFEDQYDTISPGLFFTQKGDCVLGRVGNYMVMWEANTGAWMGAARAQNGIFTQLCEENNVIYTASSSSPRIKVFDLTVRPLAPVLEAKIGAVSRDCLWNGRVSDCAIKIVSTSPFTNSQLLACVDEKGRLYVFSIQTGARVDGMPDTFWQDVPVHTAVVAGPQLVVYVTYASPGVFFLKIPENAACATSATVVSYPLPRELLWEPEVKARLYSSYSIPSHLGLMHAYRTQSRLVVYKTDTPTKRFQLIAEGEITFAAFLNEFAYSIERGQRIRLWNLSRGLERASYKHPYPITAATVSKGTKNAILCIDSTEAIYSVMVRNISSPIAAQFVLTKIERPSLFTYYSPKVLYTMVCVRESVLILSGENGEEMQLGITAANHNDQLHKTPVRGICCICTGIRDHDEVLIVGHKDGRLWFYRVVEPMT